MHSKIIAAILVSGALIVPTAGYSQSQGSPNAAPKATVGEKIDDAVITTKIKAEMAKDKAVSATSIKVDTDKGVVQLSGTAKSKAEAEKAAVIARSVTGVTSVKNDIVVQAQTN
jgi:hyperosmotically inducible protein